MASSHPPAPEQPRRAHRELAAIAISPLEVMLLESLHADRASRAALLDEEMGSACQYALGALIAQKVLEK